MRGLDLLGYIYMHIHKEDYKFLQQDITMI